jgi:hypothetical protein
LASSRSSAWLFTRINPAAWLFAVFFAVQAVLFFWAGAGARGHLEYLSSARLTSGLGVGLVLYAFAYPFLTMAFGHGYPATPTFGVPCPTAIMTIGFLLTVGGRVPLTLAIVPVLWGVVGGSAAVLLAVPTDYALLGAAALLTGVLIARAVRSTA